MMTKNRVGWISFVVFLFIPTGFTWAAKDDFVAKPGTERFQPGDKAFRFRGDQEKSLKALDFYRQEWKKTPNDPEAAWRMGMASYHYGLRFVKDADEKKKIHMEGKKASEAGLKADPKCAACYFWGAINLALYADAIGTVAAIVNLNQVHEYLKEARELDPSYARGGAQRLLGNIEEKLPGIFGGSNDEAKQYYEEAIQVGPDEPLNYLFLANLMENAFNNRKAAREAAKKGLSVPQPGEERIESVEAMDQLREFLKKHPASESKDS